MTREPSPVHARAAHPACPACGGTGRVHIQHKRPFRVESRECDCWRVVEKAADEREFSRQIQDKSQAGVTMCADRMRRLQGEAP